MTCPAFEPCKCGGHAKIRSGCGHGLLLMVAECDKCKRKSRVVAAADNPAALNLLDALRERWVTDNDLC